MNQSARIRTLSFAACLVACLACDQATKQVASHALGGAGAVSVAGDLVRFELVSNPGAFLSLGANLPPGVRNTIFVVVVPLALLVLVATLLRSGSLGTLPTLGLALLVGGGLGNWVDRVQAGAVTDFVSLGIGPLRTGIFNLADVAILAGAALLFFGGLRSTPEPEEAGTEGPLA